MRSTSAGAINSLAAKLVHLRTDVDYISESAPETDGNLAAVITHELARGGTPPSFQVLIYPMLDATASSASYEEFATGYGFSSE